MTNKEIISYENERLEKLRKYLMEEYVLRKWKRAAFFITELGEIIYELETKIKDNGQKN